LNEVTNTAGTSAASDGFFVVDGDNVTTNCSLQVDSTVEGLKTEVLSVRFESADDARVAVSLLSGAPESKTNELYSPTVDDPCRLLAKGSTIAVPYTVKPRLKGWEGAGGGVTASLGTIAVDWKPSPLPLSTEAKLCIDKLNGISSHGPLRLDAPGTLRFAGPSCAIRSPPFAVAIQSVPSAPRAGYPFDLAFRITNRTALHQPLSVTMSDPAGDEPGSLLYAGTTGGELVLSPRETRVLAYTMIATTPGKWRLPSLEVVARRTGAAVLSEEGSAVYVFP
jgi:hypothetical protein